jgi:RNA polymerase sigma-70 factor, ECF subfamily
MRPSTYQVEGRAIRALWSAHTRDERASRPPTYDGLMPEGKGRAAHCAPSDDPETTRWLLELGSAGVTRDHAVGRLHELLLRVAHAEIRRRADRPAVTGPELDDLAHQAADDAVLAVIAKLSQFRGDSRFTTWAYRFVVLEVSTKLGRHFWQRSRIELDRQDWERVADRFGVPPEDHALRREFVDAVRGAIEDQLSKHQRQVFVAIVVDCVPAEALAITIGSNRNAIYKTVYDARRTLRAALVAKGYLDPVPEGAASEAASRRAIK